MSAALLLGRSRRSVVVVDSGQPRNAPADGVHGLLGREGIMPSDLLAAGRDEVRGYGGEILSGEVNGARRDGETAGTGFPTKFLTDCAMPIYFSGQPKAAEMVHGHLTKVIAKGLLSPVSGLISPTQSTRGVILSQRLTAATNDILLGRAPVSSWTGVMMDWRRSGGDKIRAEYEEALAVRRGS